MVELGPPLTDPPGVNLGNLANQERMHLATASQGPDRGRRQTWESYAAGETMGTLPGLHLARADGMPAAAMATCVGGMGAHWSCVTPRPGDSERISFIGEDDWAEAVATSERLLHTTHDLFSKSAGGEAIRSILAGLFDPMLPPGRAVGNLPIAARLDGNGRLRFTGVDTILSPVPELLSGEGSFELRSETICRSLTVVGDRVTGATVEHLPTRRRAHIAARAVVVAADAFRTPQLLWASGIRPNALGRYLTDHPRTNARVELDADMLPSPATDDEPPSLRSAFQVPFADPQHPFVGHIAATNLSAATNMDAGSLRRVEEANRHVGFAGLSWLGRTSPRFENGLSFSDEESDWCGMPAMTIEYEMTDPEWDEALLGLRLLDLAASALGRYVPGGEPRMVPAGWSMHYMGTVRMGERDDGASVCDLHSKVWEFQNLFVGGNCVISTATTCNPTLMSVALASHSAAELANMLG